MKNILTGIGALFMLAILIAITAVACNDPMIPQKSQEYPQVSSYGNGVFYFPYTRYEFGKALSSWREKHNFKSACQIISVVSDDTYGYGSTTGYFVITYPSCEE